MMSKTIVSLEDVYIAFCLNKSLKKKAIAGLVLSSGLNAETISKLSLKDFVIACEFSFDNNDDNVLDKLLNQNPRKIVPCWHIESEKRITFNTPETTQLIFLYLKERFAGEVYSLTEPLFDSKASNISRNVTDFKDALIKVKNIDKNYFKPKNLENTFDNVCQEHIVNMDPTSKANLIDLFKGKSDENNPFYIKAMDDINSIRKYYIDLIPYLTAYAYDLNHLYEIYKNTLEKQNFDIYKIINTYYDSHIKYDLKSELSDELLLLQFAYEIASKEQFSNSENYLDRLFKKARVYLKLEHAHYFDNYHNNYGDYYSEPTDVQTLSRYLFNSIKSLNISEIIRASDEELKRIIMKNVVSSKAYTAVLEYTDAGEFISIILFKIIDEENII